jgi:hypothetical protein
MFKWLKQLTCKHWQAILISWTIISFDSVRVLYRCVDCEKDISLILMGKEAFDWMKSMDDYKRV